MSRPPPGRGPLGGNPVTRHAPMPGQQPPLVGQRPNVDRPFSTEPNASPSGQHQTPVGPNELRRAFKGGQEGPFLGRTAPGVDEAPYSQQKRAFLSHFPGFDLKQWRRTVSVLASDIGIGGGSFPFGPVVVPIEQVGQTNALVITGVRLEWLQRNYNPYGSAMPAGAIGYHDEMDNADACVQVLLLADGSPLVDVREQVYSYGAGGVGPPVSRTINGWFKLHANVLEDTGNHPSALYVQAGQQLSASWYTVSNPNFQPDYLSVTVDGWSTSFETLRRIQQAAGVSF